jgi:hypothetical protein
MEYRDHLIYINEIIDANYNNIQNMIYYLSNNDLNNDFNNDVNNYLNNDVNNDVNNDNNIEFRDDIIYNNEIYDFIHFDYLIKIFNNLFI